MSYLSELNTSEIENIFIYVGDDVRYDFLPDEIANLGVSGKMIAGGTISPTSFATITSGLHYPQHQVNDFDTPLPENAPNLFHSTSHTTAFCNTINHTPFNENPQTDNILAPVLQIDDSPSDTIEAIDPPFVVMERGPGGHSPYGDFDGNASEYFRNRGNAPRYRYAAEYQDSIQTDIEWFRSQYDSLRERNLGENTLVIYMSDHGELLGEQGCIGHNAPSHRRLVEVPCVFIHPSLPKGDTRQQIIRHVDLLPTMLAAADISSPGTDNLPGVDLCSESGPQYGTSYYLTEKFDDSAIPTLSVEYESIWDATGGYVFPVSRTFDRFAAAMWSLLRGPKSDFQRQRSVQVLHAFLSGAHQQGSPQFGKDTAWKVLTRIAALDRPAPSRETLTVQKERLEELGYLE